MREKSSPKARRKNALTVTVGIPAYNEEKTISKLLNSLREQSTEGYALEEIVVDASGSTDATEAKVLAAIRDDSRIKLVSSGRREGKAAALNSILREVSGDIALFIDADVDVERNAVSALVHPFLDSDKAGICSGNTMPMKHENGFFDFASFFIRSLHHELCSYLMSHGMTPKVNGTFYAIRRNILDAFPRNVVSDDEYASWRAQQRGYNIVYVPDAMVYTRDPHTLREFVRWQKRIIAGQMYMKRHFNYQVPTMRVSVMVASLPKLLNKHKRRVMSLLALSSLGALSYLLAFVTYLRNDVPYAY